MSIDTEQLLKALDDERNDTLFNFTTKKMHEMTLKILKELSLSEEETMKLFEKLLDYKYIDDMDDIKSGTIIRWINLEDPNNIKLSNCANFCGFRISNSGVWCRCRGMNQCFFFISMDKCLIFQKLTPQESVLLCALDHLAKE